MDQYTVLIGGVPHTLLLTDDDAKRLGVDKAKPSAPAAAASPEPEGKRKQPANKARTTDGG